MPHDNDLSAYVALANLLPFVLEDYMPDYATPDFKAAIEAAKAVVARTPVEKFSQLRETCPLVLYFANEEDRAEMIAAVEALPGIESLPL